MAGNGLLFRVLGLGLSIAFVYMAFGDLRFSYREPEMGFVERNGTQFILDGRVFYVNGWNSYWLMGQAVEEFSRPRVKEMFQVGAKMGLTVCRTWAFNDGTHNALQVSLGRFDERVFRALDGVIAEARTHGIKLILSLANNLEDYGGKPQYVKWAWEKGIGLNSSADSFFFDPSIRSYFKSYLKTLLTRKNHLTGMEYRDDPTIFAWELINEPRCPSDGTGNILQGWIEEMAGYVKTLDKKHMLTVGHEGFYGSTSHPEKLSVNPGEWANYVGSDFIRNFNVASIDFASVHLYTDQWLGEPNLDLDEKIKYVSKWLTSHIEDGDTELKKPVMLTEFGLSNRKKNFDHSHWDVFYKAIFDIFYESARRNRSGAGAFVWQLFVGGMEEFNDGYAIVPSERPSIYRLIKKQSCRLASIRYGQDWERRRLSETCLK